MRFCLKEGNSGKSRFEEITVTVAQGPQVRPGVLTIDPYVPGTSQLPGTGPIIKLSSNETPHGSSPKARQAYRQAADKLDRYPDGSSTVLRNAIGARFGLNPDRIVCGCGSDEILHLLSQAYLGPGDEAIFTEHGFLVYRIVTLAAGATPVIAPETNFRADVDAILAKVTPSTRIVFVANPNNPTGTYLGIDEIRRLHGALPSNVLLVLDAAYAEYVKRNDYEAGIELVATTPNTVMTRTFSKIHGLAGARVGWAYCPAEISQMLNRIRGPFNVTGAGMAAAVAALEDRTYESQSVAHNAEWLPWLEQEMKALGLDVTDSVGNFLLIRFPDTPGRRAAEADAFLQSRRIILRRLENYGIPDGLRMTVGLADENRTVVSALKDFVNGAAADA
ncbi:MAG: histidinol-phosphate transaminase [Hyphomicrobiales bacterium]|nr:histidinol-phosphate transaminase [Hyphomicrobiales bacterium]